MALIPHPPIFLTEVRPLDIWFLLAVGMGWELVSRSILLSLKKKPISLVKKEEMLELLTMETNHMRKMGPPKFVETSKMERQVLAKERELENIKTQRKAVEIKVQKLLGRYGNMVLTVSIYLLFYGVPVLTMKPPLLPVLEYSTGDALLPTAGPTLRTMLFPLSYIGFAMRLSRWGLPDPTHQIGALIVLWSGQVFCGKLMDALDALLL